MVNARRGWVCVALSPRSLPPRAREPAVAVARTLPPLSAPPRARHSVPGCRKELAAELKEEATFRKELAAAPVFLAKHALADKAPPVDARDSAVDVRVAGADVKVDEWDSGGHVRASRVDVRACEGT